MPASHSPPLRGRCPAGQRGVWRRHFKTGSFVAARGCRRGLHRSGNGARFSCLSVGIEVARKARPAGRCPDCRPVTRAICALAAFPQPT